MSTNKCIASINLIGLECATSVVIEFNIYCWNSSSDVHEEVL